VGRRFAGGQVEDTDATARRALELGGKIAVPPANIPTIGRFSVVTDPQDAVVAFISFTA